MRGDVYALTPHLPYLSRAFRFVAPPTSTWGLLHVYHDRRGTAPTSRSCPRGPNPAGNLLICAETRLAKMLAGSARVRFETMVLLRGECLLVGYSCRSLALLLPLEYYHTRRSIWAALSHES